MKKVAEGKQGMESRKTEEEGAQDYMQGEYYPIDTFECFKRKRYMVLSKLGQGFYSTVWRAADTQLKKYVALKVQKSGHYFTRIGFHEIDILEELQQDDSGHKNNVVKLLDDFSHTGPNGQHVCMVFELLGDNLSKFLRNNIQKRIPLPIVKEICVNVLKALDYLHEKCKIIHTDLKPENILLLRCEDSMKSIATAPSLLPSASDLGRTATEGFEENKGERFEQEARLGVQDCGGAVLTDFFPKSISAVEGFRGNRKTNLKKMARLGGQQRGDAVRSGYSSELNLGKTGIEGLRGTQKERVKQLTTLVGQGHGETTIQGKIIQNSKLRARDCENKDLARVLGLGETAIQGKLKAEQQARVGVQHIGDVLVAKCEEIKSDVNAQAEQTHIYGSQKILDYAMAAHPLQHKRKPRNSIPSEIQQKVMGSLGLQCKIADLGNACRKGQSHKHITKNIRSRNYMSPETLLQSKISTSADIWSFACIAFELATGDFLFNPRSSCNYDMVEDHLALMTELLGEMPKTVALDGKLSPKYFDKDGHLKGHRNLQPLSLVDVLRNKYGFAEIDANDFSDFLVPLLHFEPEKRSSASQALVHPWLNTAPHLQLSSSGQTQKNYKLKQ
ncbi:hypothetical protein SUGI_1171130 [Cryptomeria japonica]|nr:hypothetical protein SUGI_1171130 [Cryptomeria japonica]